MTQAAPTFDNQLRLETDADLKLDPRQLNATERMNALFQVDVVAFSRDPSIDLNAVVGRPASASLLKSNGDLRRWTGLCSHFELLQAEPTGYSTYHLRIVPPLWLTTQRRNYRIFQHASELEIVMQLLSEWRIEPHTLLDPGSYPAREYRVQYGESDFTFMSRLLEDSGISYFFDLDSKLVLSDAPQAGSVTHRVPFVENTSGLIRGQHVTGVQIGQRVRPGRYMLRDRDYRLPASYPLAADAQGGLQLEQPLERYHYVPGAFTYGASGGDTPSADDRGAVRSDESAARTLVQRRLEAKRGNAKLFTFETSERDMTAGQIVVIDNHPHQELAADRGLLVLESRQSANAEGEHHQRIEAVAADLPYRPPLATPKPRAFGVETATVVGPAGEEIHTDEFGRVRVHFHWDRYSQMNESSSCWIPTSQPWAGTGFGGVSLPRVGQEVTVSFLGGDPDKPLIVGRVYTADNPVPYALPANKTQSGWKSNTYPGGGGFNEVRFEDAAGSQLLYLQAEKDMETLVKNDQRTLIKNDQFLSVEHDREKVIANDERVNVQHDRDSLIENDEQLVVNNNRTKVIGNDESVEVKNNRTEIVGNDESIVIKHDRIEGVLNDESLSVANNRAITVGANLQEQVGQNRSRMVSMNETAMIGQNRSLTVGADQTVNVTANQSTTIGANESKNVGAMQAVNVGTMVTEKVGVAKMENIGVGYMLSVGAGMNVSVGAVSAEQAGMMKLIVAGQKLQLLCGSAAITMEASGAITIKGTSVQIEGSDGVKINGKIIDLN